MTETTGHAARLILLRPGTEGRQFPLGVGVHTIGRPDSDSPGNVDILIADDPGISREAAIIEVTDSDGDLFYKLSAPASTTNAVLHNYTPIVNGRSVMLNYGDTIVIGHTKMRFDRAL